MEKRGPTVRPGNGRGAALQIGGDPAAGLLSPTLDSLLIAAELGSFSAAARALGLHQSTVSRQIQELEDRLGVSVFERHGSGIRPTDAGHQLLERATQVRTLLQAAVDDARDAGAARTGRLRLGFVGSFATSPAKDIVSRLRDLHPGLRIQLTELGATDLIQQVLAHQLDCAWVGSWRSPDPVLVIEPLWCEPLYLAMPAASASAESVGWAALSGQVLLARPEAELDLLFPVLQAAGVTPPDAQFHDCSRESLIALVAEGHGVAILPESYARSGRAGIHFARIHEPRSEVAICVMYRRDRDNPALRRLLAVSRAWLRDNPSTRANPSALG